MTHYSIEDWADFGRRAVTKKREAVMQRHLDSGCKQCGQAQSMWQAVMEAAQQETTFEPPADVVRIAKSAYALARPEKGAHWLTDVANMVFDSFREPLPAGVRASRSQARQIMYKHGSLAVDIRVQPEPGTDRYSLVGQVLDTESPDRPPKPRTVLLRAGNERVSKTRTNQFGEFHFEVAGAELPSVGIEVGRHMRMFVPLRGGQATKPSRLGEN